MSLSLKLLLAEDSESDAELIIRQLRNSGYNVQSERVEDAPAMAAALKNSEWDLIVSDYRMPGFDAPAALSILRRTGLDIPFLIVSGAIGEDQAVAMIKAGANDYLMKGNLKRLGSAVDRELREAVERKSAALALRESDERFRRISDADVIGVLISDGERLLEMNDHLLRILGYTREEFEGMQMTWRTITPPELIEGSRIAFRHVGGEGGSCQPFEKEYVRKDGTRVPVLVTGVGLHETQENRVLVLVIDLTERRKLENQFRQAQKLESVGQLAGGVAHDFNNLLTVILGYAHMALSILGPAHPVRDCLEEIATAADRAAGLTRQLLMFSRRSTGDPKTIQLDTIVLRLEGMLRRLIGEDIEIVLAPGAETGFIHADPALIEQVIVNLAVNARDAMPDGGRLFIETSHITISDAFAAQTYSAPPGTYVLLGLTDTGIGMTPDVQARIFEPFFTTKEPDKGTGLGLSTVYGIVKQSGGAITLVSVPGVGTAFRVLFPAVYNDSSVQASEPAEPPARGTETVLVVEDEPVLRGYLRKVLTAHGYRVLDAPAGPPALEIARLHGGPIQLLLTDAVLPGMNGAEVATEFQVLRPRVPVLLMSGYPERFDLHLKREIPLMRKPFTAEAVLKRIRGILDEYGQSEYGQNDYMQDSYRRRATGD
jgi:two-component system cell cycle sensor histidine kinase/response regulator CckA